MLGQPLWLLREGLEEAICLKLRSYFSVYQNVRLLKGSVQAWYQLFQGSCSKGWVEAAPRGASVGAGVLGNDISPFCASLTSELMLFRRK